MCMYPQLVANWDYTALAKKSSIQNAREKTGHNYVTGPVQNWNDLVPRPCGKCPECLRDRSIGWSFRLSEEQKYSKSAYFLTLTYSDEWLPTYLDDPTLSKPDLHKFLHRMRYHVNSIHYLKKQPDFSKYGEKEQLMKQAYHDHYGHRCKYYAIGEYGTLGDRPHYHAIMFNVPRPVIDKLPKIWNKGHIKIGKVEPASIRYVANYIMYLNTPEEEKQKEFATISNGVGEGWIYDNLSLQRKKMDATVEYNGHTVPMPKYYRDKVYIPEERQIQGEKNQDKWQEGLEQRITEAKKKGYESYEAYKTEINAEKWRKFYNNRKYKKR